MTNRVGPPFMLTKLRSSPLSSLLAGYVTPQFLLPDQLSSKELTNDEVLRGTKLFPACRVSHETIYYEIRLVLQACFCPAAFRLFLGFQRFPNPSFLMFILPFLSTNLMPTAMLLLYINFLIPYLGFFLLITLNSLNWVHPLCNNDPVTTALNFVAKVFLLPQTKLHSVLLLFFIVMMFPPFAIANLHLFRYLMPHNLFTSLMACIT